VQPGGRDWRAASRAAAGWGALSSVSGPRAGAAANCAWPDSPLVLVQVASRDTAPRRTEHEGAASDAAPARAHRTSAQPHDVRRISDEPQANRKVPRQLDLRQRPEQANHRTQFVQPRSADRARLKMCARLPICVERELIVDGCREKLIGKMFAWLYHGFLSCRRWDAAGSSPFVANRSRN
jgi:hypothetical protein